MSALEVLPAREAGCRRCRLLQGHIRLLREKIGALVDELEELRKAATPPRVVKAHLPNAGWNRLSAWIAAARAVSPEIDEHVVASIVTYASRGMPAATLADIFHLEVSEIDAMIAAAPSSRRWSSHERL